MEGSPGGLEEGDDVSAGTGDAMPGWGEREAGVCRRSARCPWAEWGVGAVGLDSKAIGDDAIIRKRGANDSRMR